MAAKILLADDHDIYRSGMKSLVTELVDAVEFMETGSYVETLRAVKEEDIFLALVDLRMPGMDHAALRNLIMIGQKVPVVVVSASGDQQGISRAFEAGAMGYIVKSQPAHIVKSALQLVLAGGIYVPPALLSFQEKLTSESTSSDLTEAQLKVLALLVSGAPNKAIAKDLGISESTVKAHVAAIMRNLNVHNRTQVVIAAERLGIGRPTDWCLGAFSDSG